MKCKYPVTRRTRPILKFPRPPELLVEFPPRSQEWPEKFPALIKPWLEGTRAFWLPTDQMFQLETGVLISVDGIEPETPFDEPLEGVFWEKYKTPDEIHRMVVENNPSQDLAFNIIDIAREDDAYSRAELCVQIPPQRDDHVYIVQMLQVNTPDAFNQWLETWLGSMFQGVLAVGYLDAWGETEYEVKRPVRKIKGEQ